MECNGTVYKRLRAGNGWSAGEEELLFSEVAAARREGRPLKSVFARVAETTGRKPNSIRNFYYLRVREDERRGAVAGASGAFIPFSRGEAAELVRAVLAAQARGRSVRACTLELGCGDNKAMLRYQNKYRAVIKNDPALVRSVKADMRASGEPVFDPYSVPQTPRAGRPRRQADPLSEAVRQTVDDLSRVEGLDVCAFFEGLGALAVGAVSAGSGGAEAYDRLRERNLELTALIRARDRELVTQRERYAALMSMFRQLIDVNKDFLSVRAGDGEPPYMAALSDCVAAVDGMLAEYAK